MTQGIKSPNPYCSLGDGEPVKAGGLCQAHYARNLRHGDPLVGGPVRKRGAVSLTRECVKCKRTLPLSISYFYRRGSGYFWSCKVCCIAAAQARYQANGDAIRVQQAAYRADPERRRLDRESTARWRSENPERAKAAVAAYQARPENRELARQRSREWRIANPKRKYENDRRRIALKKSGVATRISLDLLAAKLAYWGGRCWIAGPECTGDPETWDHVKPLTKGGAHVLANLRPACKSCNRRKSARWPFPTARRSLSA